VANGRPRRDPRALLRRPARPRQLPRRLSAAGEAIVIEPNRDIGRYLHAAQARASPSSASPRRTSTPTSSPGARDLAARAGARLYLSEEGGPDFQYAFASEPNVTRIRNGSTITAGAVRLEVVHTPGHTPEHVSFLLTDLAASPAPQAMFTGDFVFVGDVGRPDLLEKAVDRAGTAERSARALFHSLEALAPLPDLLMLWPSHGAGSACGKSLGGVPVTTLGYERMTSWAFQLHDEARFVEEVLAGQPDPPTYFKVMKRINQHGAPPFEGFRVPPRLDPDGTLGAIEGGDVVVDLRRAAEYARAFVPGTLNLPAGALAATWGGWLLPYDRPIVLLAGNEGDVAASVRDLALIGLDQVRGWGLTSTALTFWNERHGAPETMATLEPAEAGARAQRGEVTLLDVRTRDEYVAGHVPGAVLVPLGRLPQRAAELDRARPLAVVCEGGSRSPIAASLLRRLGFARVADVPAGFSAYTRAGLPIETGEPTPLAAS
jgi:hydroxyacylglutathione hydrolase